MQIDRQRERLRERVATLATLVEGALVATVAAPATAAAAGSARRGVIHDDIAAVARDLQADAIEFLARYRPVATDLQFALTVLGCCADLQVAAVATCGLDALLQTLDRKAASLAVPSFDRLAACVGVVVSLATDAVGEWDAEVSDAIRNSHAEVTDVRERLRSEIAAGIIARRLDPEHLVAVDTAACMLERVAAATAACVRRLSRGQVVRTWTAATLP